MNVSIDAVTGLSLVDILAQIENLARQQTTVTNGAYRDLEAKLAAL